jgi:hypothetical protein
MDGREKLIEKIIKGGVVTESDIAQHQFSRELVELNAEASRRVAAETTRREAAEAREAQITELIELDAEVERLYIENESNEQRKAEILKPLAEREIEIRVDWDKTRRKFVQIFHHLAGSTYDFRSVNNELIKELRGRGAVLSKMNIDVFQIPISPLARVILDEREKTKS